MAKYEKYAEYKDSGVNYFGEIPSDWKVLNLRYVFDFLNEKRFPLSALERESKKGIYPYYGASGIIDYVDEYLLDEETILIAEDGANLLSRSTPLAFIAKGKYWVNNHAHILKPKNLLFNFWTYFLQSLDYTIYITGSAQPKLSREKLGEVIVLYPSLEEQTKIANFLDHETTKIDSLIEKQQQLIQLLKEKRQAVISHAVTKGINPDVPMKDSGVEWLGEVPEHWIISGFKKYLESIVDYRGKTPEKVDEGVFLVTARNIKNGQIDYALSQEFVAKKDYEQIMSRGKPILKDVLFTTEAPLGEVAQIDNVDIALAQRIIKFRGKENVLDNTYLKYFIISQQFQDSLMTFATGSTALGIKAERLGYLKIAIPPLIEQYKIVEYIEIYLLKNKSLIQKAQSAIQLMQERRTALISAAVTGKIDVRNWQNPTEAKMEFSA